MLLELTFKRIKDHPLKYTIFYIIEGSRMFFWESTQIGFVFYPIWLERLFNWTFFKNTLRLLVGIITFLAFLYVAISHVFAFLKPTSYQDTNTEKTQLIFFILWFMLLFMGIYAIVFIVVRYSFPIVPLYLICIGIFLNRFLLKARDENY